MSVRDFPPRSGHPKLDPDALVRWLDLAGERLSIDTQIELTAPAVGDELGIFDISAAKFRKITLANLFLLQLSGLLDISGASGGQIKFPATQNPSSNANTLDDYEEGTWTPVPTNLTVVGTPTYTGRYTKIGREVFVYLSVSSTISTASTAGSTYFSGLPFVCGFACPAYASNDAAANFGNGTIFATIADLYTPTWGANANVYVSAKYEV